jgi:hypothetical protein
MKNASSNQPSKEQLVPIKTSPSAEIQPWKAWYAPDSTASFETRRVVATFDDSQNGQAPNLPVAVIHRK